MSRSNAASFSPGTSSSGSLGDLSSITVRDAAGAILDAQAYRYTTALSGQSLIEYSFDSAAGAGGREDALHRARLADSSDPTTVSVRGR